MWNQHAALHFYFQKMKIDRYKDREFTQLPLTQSAPLFQARLIQLAAPGTRSPFWNCWACWIHTAYHTDNLRSSSVDWLEEWEGESLRCEWVPWTRWGHFYKNEALFSEFSMTPIGFDPHFSLIRRLAFRSIFSPVFDIFGLFVGFFVRFLHAQMSMRYNIATPYLLKSGDGYVRFDESSVRKVLSRGERDLFLSFVSSKPTHECTLTTRCFVGSLRNSCQLPTGNW